MNAEKNIPEDTREILIVEDSPTQAEVLKYLLEQHGYSVLAAGSGREALSLLDKHKPALVISDIVMPEMDGYELCRRTKSANSKQDIPVILLTSLSNAEDVLDGLECGADNFITKPYNEEYLVAHVEQIIASRKLFKNERVRVGLEIMFGGKRRFITADQQQMLTLLISTYEEAVRKNAELAKTQNMYKLLNERLEDIVEERTAALTNEVAERKQAEAKAEVLARFPSENPNPVLRIALDGTLLYINMAGTDQLEEWNLHEGRKTPSFLQEVVTEAITRGLTQVLDLEYSKRVYSFFITPVGACGYANLYGRDITDRKRAEEKIKSQLDELQRWQNALNGREGRVLEVKKEVNELLARLGEPPRYSSAAEENGK
jgi:DNA-binding response OmpR family regulator